MFEGKLTPQEPLFRREMAEGNFDSPGGTQLPLLYRCAARRAAMGGGGLKEWVGTNVGTRTDFLEKIGLKELNSFEGGMGLKN